MPNACSRRLSITAFAGLGGLLIAATAGMASPTVTLEVFFENGAQADGMVSILVADKNRNGFLSPADPSVPGTILAEGRKIGSGDDVIVAVFQADDGTHWNGSAGVVDVLEQVRFTNFGIDTGTPLVIYTFPGIIQPGTTIFLGDKVASYRNTSTGGSGGDIPFAVPEAPGVYTLATLTHAQGGNFNPDNPLPTESVETVNAGVPNSDGSGSSFGDATPLTAGQPVAATLPPGALDFYSIEVNGLSRLVARTVGDTDTIGSLFSDSGTLLNDPAADDGDPNMLIDRIIDQSGTLHLAVRGRNTSHIGAYQVMIELIPLEASLPDATIGKTLGAQHGDGTYNLSAADQTLRRVSKRRRKVKFFFTVQNDAGRPDAILVKGTPKDRTFKAVYLKISNGAANITALMKLSGFRANLAPLSEESFLLTIKPNRRARRSKKNFLIDAVSTANLGDRVQAQVKAK